MSAMSEDLFAGLDFDPSEVAAIQHAYSAGLQQAGQARAIKRSHRHHTRRAKAEATLTDLLPARFDAGDSYHVISHGDIDALSYLRHALAGVTHFDFVLLSTWCIASADMIEIQGWLDTGRIDSLTLCAGEIFPSQYGDEYELALNMVNTYGVRLIISKNHSKVTLAQNETEGAHLVIESSANVNTNPRIEQTAIHNDAELFSFYRDFFHGLRSIDKRAKSPAS